MAEKQETVWVVMRYARPTEKNNWAVGDNEAAKVFDDRKDARAYVKRMNDRSRVYGYFYNSVKKG